MIPEPISKTPASAEAKKLLEDRVAVLVPCYNEAITIARVIDDFRQALPNATIYVYDNNSTDGTAAIAKNSGAIVRKEPLQGKGNVVRRMFGDIDADVYVLVDGDDTYDANAAREMIDLLTSESLDCVNAVRHSDAVEAYRPGHRFGNWLLTTLVAKLFGRATQDMLTGYRVFTRRFVKSFPALSVGFEIETEITVHCLEMRLRVADFDTPYRGRPEGSTSKLRTYHDGLNILKMIISLIKQERPLMFFTALGGIGLLLALILIAPVFVEFLATGQVRRFPTAILSASVSVVSILSMACGLILDTVTRGRKEFKRIAYLQADPRSH